jgi:hypothetical protein
MAGAALYRRAASRRPGHAFRLNPNSGPVCPACNIWCCAVRRPVLHLRVAYFGQHPALRTSDASARPRHQRAHGVLLEGQNRAHRQSGQRCSLRWMMRRRAWRSTSSDYCRALRRHNPARRGGRGWVVVGAGSAARQHHDRHFRSKRQRIFESRIGFCRVHSTMHGRGASCHGPSPWPGIRHFGWSNTPHHH